MRITKILIENFGIYRDLCEFRFEYDSQKKVTLLKGENGSGKTTLLNSIKTVLYGPLLLGTQRQNNIKYLDFIERMLNTEAKKDAFPRFSIEVEITANLMQFSGKFRIIRSWKMIQKKIREELFIYHDNLILSESETDEFFKVFYRLYPLELFELFYLDGEKIDQLSFFDSNIHKLIESTMNIDLFKTLRSDLEAYAIKKHRTKELDALKKDKDYSLNLLEHLQDKIEKARNRLAQLELEEIETSSKINQLSKEIAESNQNLPELLQKKNDEIKEVKKVISRHIVETIPLLLLENEIDEMTRQLSSEANDSRAKIIRESLTETIKDQVMVELQSDLTRETLDSIFNVIKNQFKPTETVIHGISFDEYNELTAFLSRVNSDTNMDLKQVFETYHELVKEIKKLNEGMASYDSNRINTLLEDLLKEKTQSQLIQNEISKINEQVRTDQMQMTSVNSKINSLESEIWKAIKSENVNQVISKMTNVIEGYVKNMKLKKLESIENHTKIMFENLVRKKGFIQEVNIEEERIYLTTGEGNRILVNSLSSGEKQLFVLSVIYALVKVSERSTPLIFDTLLGRLDKNHQQEVMEKFIASCPDQVIILATDSELENIRPETLDMLVKTRYSIDLSKLTNRIEMIV